MLLRIRSAWRRYLDSIPKSDDPLPISDATIIREHFKPPAVDGSLKTAFEGLSRLLLAHLPDELRAKESKRLNSRLKPGIDPAEALSRWFYSASRPSTRPLGAIVLDWKAREEVEWQAKNLIASHGLSCEWSYDFRTDNEWREFENTGRVPVDYPLESFASALSAFNYKLVRFSPGDNVLAFAVPASVVTSVLEALTDLGIEARC